LSGISIMMEAKLLMLVDWRDCPVIDVLQIDNALELQGSRGLERSPNDLSIINYTLEVERSH
jgi:hypothetical protein